MWLTYLRHTHTLSLYWTAIFMNHLITSDFNFLFICMTMHAASIKKNNNLSLKSILSWAFPAVKIYVCFFSQTDTPSAVTTHQLLAV